MELKRENENKRINFIKIIDNNIKKEIRDNNDNETNTRNKKIKLNKKKKERNKIKKSNINKKEKADIDDDIINTDINNNNIITDNTEKNKPDDASKKVVHKKLTKVLKYDEEEMNDFSFELALKNDKRTYCQLYYSLIKTKHEFFYTFIYNKGYNSKIIKIDLYLFGFAINYAVNGLFFNDDTMHDVYENKGQFDISYQLPIIVYSSLISMLLGGLVQMLGSSSDAIIDFKQSEEKNNINERSKKLIKKLEIKFALYFLLNYILLLFFGYYISMFDAVYRNTQDLLLKDTLMGFGFSFFTPFLIYLIPGLFRIPALAAPQKKRKWLYNFSKLFTNL